jgi:DNA-directed RNA polymerase subunit H
MDAELLDLVARTRPVLLEILEDRGFNVKALENQAPDVLSRLAAASPELLNFTLDARESGSATHKKVRVLYWIDAPTRLRIEKKVQEVIFAPFEDEEADVGTITDYQFVVILSEPFHEVFHAQAMSAWAKKVHLSFFHIKNLVSNPTNHVAVSRHRKLGSEEATQVLAKFHIRNKNELPRIIFHIDMQARVLGLVPGDIVEIQRSSPTAGVYVAYRVCST